MKRTDPVVHVRVVGNVSRERLFEVYESLLQGSISDEQSVTGPMPILNQSYGINLDDVSVSQAIVAERASKIIESII